MKVTLVCTVLNEAKSMPDFLGSLVALDRWPDELVICDGGSTDDTVEIVHRFANKMPYPVRVLQVKGNISVGRNAAIRAASFDIIAVTDAGCRVGHDWLTHLLRPFEGNNEVDVVSGLYEAAGETWFERCSSVITLSTKGIHAETFLPSARSIAFRRDAWKAVGGFPEHLDYAEDTYFDLALQREGYRFFFVPDARVFWRPRSNLRGVFKQFRNYARGDRMAGINKAKYFRLFLRYSVWIGLGPLGLINLSLIWLWLFMTLPYWFYWAITGWRECHDLRALWLVPFVKFVVDVASIMGYLQANEFKAKS